MKEFRYLSHEYSEDIYTPIPYRPWKERFLLLFELKTLNDTKPYYDTDEPDSDFVSEDI